jgi:hypothetical protein
MEARVRPALSTSLPMRGSSLAKSTLSQYSYAACVELNSSMNRKRLCIILERIIHAVCKKMLPKFKRMKIKRRSEKIKRKRKKGAMKKRVQRSFTSIFIKMH